MPKSELLPITCFAPVEIQAALEGDKPSPPRFSVLAYTGGPLVVAKYELPVVLDLEGLAISKSVTANLHHDQKQIVGHVTSNGNDGQRLELNGLVSGTGAAAQEFLANARNEYPWQASVEAMPTSRPELIPSGKFADVNGQHIPGPVLLVRKSRLLGVAFVPRGADQNTSVRIAATAADEPTRERDMEFDKWIEATGLVPAELTDKQRAGLQTKYDAEIKASAKDEGVIDAPEFDVADIKAAASDHLANLEAIFAEFDGSVKADKFAEVRAEASKAAKDLKTKALKERWAGVRYESELVKAAADTQIKLVRAERPTGPAIHSSSRIEANNEVIEAALCQSMSLPDIEKKYKPEVLEAAHKAYRGRMGIQQALIMGAEANGYSQREFGIHNGNIRDILRYAFATPIHAASSTLSLPGVFSNVANKELLTGYTEEDQSWREVAAIKSVNDFKQATSYRLLDNMEYEELGQDGKIKHGSVGEETYTRQAKTYAKMFALTRVDIVNDDLGAFDDLRSRLGMGAAKKFNNIFWTRFMANSTFFTAGRANYITGATSNLGIDGVGLELAITAFRKLRSPSGDGEKRIGGRPELLLVPPELEFIADKLYVSSNVNTGGSSTAASVPSSNIHANKYKPVVVDWLSDSDFTGNSATAFYLLRAPRYLAAAVVSFLNGVQTPVVESADADFDQMGVVFRGYHDFGVDLAEPFCGVKSKGAA